MVYLTSKTENSSLNWFLFPCFQRHNWRKKKQFWMQMAAHSSTLAWKIPWTEEPGGLHSAGSLRVRQDWTTSLSLSLYSLVQRFSNLSKYTHPWKAFVQNNDWQSLPRKIQLWPEGTGIWILNKYWWNVTEKVEWTFWPNRCFLWSLCRCLSDHA